MEMWPADVGVPSEMNWTSFLVRDWIEREFDVKYSDRGVRKDSGLGLDVTMILREFRCSLCIYEYMGVSAVYYPCNINVMIGLL